MGDPAPSFAAAPMHSFVVRARAWILVASVALAVLFTAGGIRISEHGYAGVSLAYNLIGVVETGSPADRAGLRPGDRILRLNGIAFAQLPFAEARIRTPRAFERIHLDVVRGPSPALIPLELITSFPPWGEVVWRLVLTAAGLLCLGLAFLTLWQRPGALTLLFWCVLVGFAWLMREPVPATRVSTLALNSLCDDVVQLALPGLLVHFFLLFPEPRPFLARRRWVLALPYVMPVVLFAPVSVLLVREAAGTPASHAWRSALEMLSALGFAASAVVSLGLFAQSFFATRVAWARRRLRVAVVGTIAGVTPVVVVMLWMMVEPTTASSNARYAVLSLLLVPLAFVTVTDNGTPYLFVPRSTVNVTTPPVFDTTV